MKRKVSRKAARHESREPEAGPLKIDQETAIKILKRPPRTPARRSPEDVKAAKDILMRINANPIEDEEVADAAEDLDKYIYKAE